jgi:NDP-sugar pyrophosphorylase family protein
MQIIVPMSGVGKRFADAGYTVPKYMLPANGKPIIQHIIELFQIPSESAETQSFHFILNSTDGANTEIRTFLQTLVPTCTIHTIDHHTLGPVYAVSKIFEDLSNTDEVIVSYCDYGSVWNYQEFLKTMRSNKCAGGIACYTGFHPHMLHGDLYAFCQTESADSKRLVDIQEKKSFTDNPLDEYASNGTYYFESGMLMKDYFQKLLSLDDQKVNNEFYVSMVYKQMLLDHHKIFLFEIEKMLQFGTPRDYVEFQIWETHFRTPRPPLCPSDATLVLPLAGAGSRFLMKGYTVPKPLLKVNEKPMIVEAVSCLPPTSNQVFVTLQEHVDKYPLLDLLGHYFPSSQVVSIHEVTQGQACTCEIAIQATQIKPSTPILISACDNGVDYDPAAYAALEADKTNDVIVWAFSNNPTSKLNPHMYAWLDVDETNTIRHVSVKKHFEGAKHCIIGTMYFREADLFNIGLEEIYSKNIRTNNEFYVDDLLNPLIEKGYTVKMFNVDRYICWGTPNDYQTYTYWREYFSSDSS